VPEDAYMGRLVKLVPAEAVGTFPLLLASARELAPDSPSEPRWTVYFVAWVMLLIVLVLRTSMTWERGKGPQWGAVLIAAVGFFMWAQTLDGAFGFEMLYKHLASPAAEGATRSLIDQTVGNDKISQFVTNVSLTAWTMLAPVVYRGDDQG
jgi:hypothetical protein